MLAHGRKKDSAKSRPTSAIAWTIARSALLSMEFSRQESPLSFFRMLRQLGWEVIPGVAEKWEASQGKWGSKWEAPYPAGYLLVASGTRCGTQPSIAHPKEEGYLSSACTCHQLRSAPWSTYSWHSGPAPQDRVPRRYADSSGRIPRCVLEQVLSRPGRAPVGSGLLGVTVFIFLSWLVLIICLSLYANIIIDRIKL